MAEEFDVIVIGAGPAGEVVARRLAMEGLSVAAIERELVAGECGFWACMPSKALLRPVHQLAEARRVPGVEGAVLDVAEVLRRRDEVVRDFDDAEPTSTLTGVGITVLRGEGRLIGERAVAIGGEGDDAGRELTARRAVVVATGTRAALPPIDGLLDAAPWTNREATTFTKLPARVILLGGGPVGCELADAYVRLGAEVTLIDVAPRLLANEEPFVSTQLAEALRAQGVRLVLGAHVSAVQRPEPGGVVTVKLDATTDPEQLEADELIVVAGRTPNTDRLGLESVGVQPSDGGYLEVDRRLLVPGKGWLYALGDVNGRAPLTHEGKYQAHVAAQVIRGSRSALLRDGAPPVRCVFTEPEVAAVGHTEATAEEAGIEVRVVDVPTDGTAGASFTGKGVGGTSRLLIDEQRGVIVGATFTGFGVSELLHAATIAITAAVPVAQLWEAPPAFPTRSEIWLRLLEEYEGW